MKERMERALRILRLSRGFAPRTDGWSRHVLRLSEEQARAGHVVTVVQPLARTSRVGSLRILRAPTPWPEPRGSAGIVAFCLAAVPALAREAPSADVVHVHGDVLEIATGLLVAAPVGHPVLVTLHSVLSRKRRHRLAFSLVAPRVAGFVAVSESVRRDLLARGVRNERVLVQSSGVDLAEFERAAAERVRVRAALAVSEGEFLVIYVGRIEPVKGVELLLEAAQLLPSGTRVLVVGDGSLREALARRAPPQVVFLGPVPHERVPGLFAASDAFVLPSVDLPGHSEGAPTAILEAFAARVPVIVTRSGGIADLVVDGRTGILVAQRDATMLARAVRRLHADESLRTELVRNAREAVESLDWPRVTRRITDFTRFVAVQARR